MESSEVLAEHIAEVLEADLGQGYTVDSTMDFFSN